MRRRGLAALLLGCALLTGCAPVGVSVAPASTAASAASAAPLSTLPPPPIVAATLPAPTVHPLPVRVVVEGRDIDMEVVPVGVAADGSMELPADPAVAGWYRFGPGPWDGAGSVVLAAHIDAPDYPIGPLADLGEVPVGTVVTVVGADGDQARYAVTSVTYYPKAQLPVGDLFARGSDRSLVLITCGGAYDEASGHYDDNVVAVATAAP